MGIRNVMLALIILWSCSVINGQAARQPNAAESPENLRQILANQPDYTAIMQFLFSEGFGGFGATSKVAKMGGRFREEMDDRILITEQGKPTITIFPKRKEYAERPAEKEETDFAVSPEGLAKRNDVSVKYLGTEKIDSYNCIKIEITYNDEKLTGMNFVFYVAPELRNLIIKEEASLGEKVKIVTLLSGVAFNVSEDLFRVPAGYKKVVIESPRERLEKMRRKLKPPPNDSFNRSGSSSDVIRKS